MALLGYGLWLVWADRADKAELVAAVKAEA
jgi:hypothetical protein